MSSLKDRALEIKNEVKKGKNTANRVGGVIADMVDFMEFATGYGDAMWK